VDVRNEGVLDMVIMVVIFPDKVILEIDISKGVNLDQGNSQAFDLLWFDLEVIELDLGDFAVVNLKMGSRRCSILWWWNS